MQKDHLKTSFLCEKLIQANTTDFTRRRLNERVKMFSVQQNIGDFQKDFIFNKLKKIILPPQLS